MYKVTDRPFFTDDFASGSVLTTLPSSILSSGIFLVSLSTFSPALCSACEASAFVSFVTSGTSTSLPPDIAKAKPPIAKAINAAIAKPIHNFLRFFFGGCSAKMSSAISSGTSTGVVSSGSAMSSGIGVNTFVSPNKAVGSHAGSFKRLADKDVYKSSAISFAVL